MITFSCISKKDYPEYDVVEGQVLGLAEISEKIVEDGATDGALPTGPWIILSHEWVQVEGELPDIQPMTIPLAEDVFNNL